MPSRSDFIFLGAVALIAGGLAICVAMGPRMGPGQVLRAEAVEAMQRRTAWLRLEQEWDARRPEGPDTSTGTIHLTCRPVDTSGGGEGVYHIIDPRVARPARASVSVTVTAPDATDADARATGLFVLDGEAAVFQPAD